MLSVSRCVTALLHLTHTHGHTQVFSDMLISCDWTPISSLEGSLGAKRKMRSYDMGCDCGKRRVTDTEKEKCKESAQLEAPDQVCKFDAGKPGPSLAFEYKKLLTARR